MRRNRQNPAEYYSVSLHKIIIFCCKKLTKNVKYKEMLDFLIDFDIINPSEAKGWIKCYILIPLENPKIRGAWRR